LTQLKHPPPSTHTHANFPNIGSHKETRIDCSCGYLAALFYYWHFILFLTSDNYVLGDVLQRVVMTCPSASASGTQQLWPWRWGSVKYKTVIRIIYCPSYIRNFESTHCLACSIHVDFRRENAHFSVSASCVTISNPDLLSSNETGVNPGIRSWKKHLNELDVRKPLVVSISQRSEELRLYNLV
jgi:hypothetical protein